MRADGFVPLVSRHILRILTSRQQVVGSHYAVIEGVNK